MKYITRALPILLILLTLPILMEGASPAHYEGKTIDRLDIIVKNAPAHLQGKGEEVRGRIRTKTGDLFSQDSFDEDLKILSSEFTSVTPELEVHGNQLSISIEVNLRPMIRSIQFEGNRCQTSSKLRKEIDLSPQVVFDSMVLSRAVHQLKLFYVKKGFFEVEIEWDLCRDEHTNEVDIIFNIDEGRSGKIEAIVFRGFDRCEKNELLERMLTKTWHFLTCWFTDDGIYNPDLIEHDRFTILTYLQDRGFADAEVCINVKESKSSNRIVVEIVAEKGSLYTFGSITFEGNSIFSNEEIQQQICIQEGRPYSPGQLRNSGLNILDLYGRHGYIESDVLYEPSLDEECPRYDVHFEIKESEQYRVGLIRVCGNCSTQTKVILHETLMIPGQIFNQDLLKRTEERLSNIGYFSSVNVYATPSEGLCGLGENYQDIYIEVEEQGTGNFSLFGGFSNVENIFGGVQISEKNFNYEGFGKIFKEGLCALRGGGEYAYLRMSVGQKSRSYVLSWTKPYFWDTKWIVGFDIDKTIVNYVSSEYNIDSMGVVLHAKYPLNIYTKLGAHYRIRNANIEVKNTASQSEQLRREAGNDGLISAVGASIQYDDTDNPRRATKGFRSTFLTEFAGVGGDSTFFSFAYTNAWYYPITCDGDDVLKIRADARFIQPIQSTTFSTLPLDERLFLGGDNAVRGYKPYALGPKFIGTDIPRGGLSMTLLSAELAHRFSPKWEVFGFVDAGQLSEEKWEVNHLKTSAGIGARICILPGAPPLTIGLGWPIGEKNSADVQHFFFSLGASF